MNKTGTQARFLVIAVVILSCCGACAGYRAVPLNNQPPAPLAQITVPASTLLPGGMHSHVFDPTDGLDITEVAMLAITQAPELNQLRAEARIAHAQAYAAGLLPDPVAGISSDRPLAGQPDAATAITRALSWDIGNLVTLSARQSVRRQEDMRVNLALLWAEWQTVMQARLHFLHIVHGRARVARLTEEVNTLRPLVAHTQAAVERATLAADTAAIAVSAFVDSARQLSDASVNLNAEEQALRLLLGLSAAEPLALVGDADLAPLDEAGTDNALSHLTQRRADLRALAAGYAAQEARVRSAILGQFPAINLGFNRSRDNSGIGSTGYGLAVSLPLFDGNRGAIRIERATRAQLRAEYTLRLLTAQSDIAHVRASEHGLTTRAVELRTQVALLEIHLLHATDAYTAGTLDWMTYLNLRQSALAASLDLSNVNESIAECHVTLALLLFRDTDQSTASAEGASP